MTFEYEKLKERVDGLLVGDCDLPEKCRVILTSKLHYGLLGMAQWKYENREQPRRLDVFINMLSLAADGCNGEAMKFCKRRDAPAGLKREIMDALMLAQGLGSMNYEELCRLWDEEILQRKIAPLAKELGSGLILRDN